MYGLLAHAGCGLNLALRNEWMSHLCGVCLVLKQQAGQLVRFAVNGEAALLSALVSAQTTRPTAWENNTCFLRQPRHLRVIEKKDSGVRFGAGMAILMASTKLHDHLHDGEIHPHILRHPLSNLAHRWEEIAQQVLVPLGFDPHLISDYVDEQLDLEGIKWLEFSTYARPTELSVGAAFAHTAYMTNNFDNAPLLFEIGQIYGRVLYLVDSFKDFERDTEHGIFNALSAAFSTRDISLQAANLFHASKQELNSLVSKLYLPKADLVQAVLVHRLGQIGQQALGLCRSRLADCKSPHPAAFSIEPGPGHYLPPEEAPGDHQQPSSRFGCNPCGPRDNDALCYCCSDCCIYPPNCDCSHLAQGCDCGNMCHDCNCGDTCDCSHCDCGNCDCGNCDCGNCDCGNCDCSGCS